MKTAILTSMCLLSLFITACKKEKSSKPPTKTELITSKAWKYDKVTIAGQDAGGQVPNCYKDNLYTLKTDKTGTIDESTDVCTPSTAGNFTWRFSSNEDSLILSMPLIAGLSGSFKIDSLGVNVMKLSQTVNLPPLNLPVPAVFQLKH